MMKMSPALLVLWWLLRGRFLAVGAAILTALVLSVLTLPLVDASTQLRFYTAVLPRFASGDYNGLTVPIDLWGNHSIPNVLHVLFPGAPNRLSPTAQELSRIVAIGALGIAAAAWWRPPTDDVARQGQIAAVFGIMLLLPVYTYEHHLLWQLPALAVAMAGLVSGRLHPGWTPIVVFAWIFFLWPTNHLKALSQSDTGGGWGPLLREAKFLGLLASTFAAGAVGRARPD